MTEITTAIALALGVSWASGINLYAAVATLGLMQMTGSADLPEELGGARRLANVGNGHRVLDGQRK